MEAATPYSLLAELEKVRHKDRPPLEKWHPDNVRDIDITIEADGTWTYLGTPITRQRLAHLFSTVLRKEDDGDFYLVTPVEKCRIQVKDAPFLAVRMQEDGQDQDQTLVFTTNMADEVAADSAHPLRSKPDFATDVPVPYLLVRDGLEAKLTRNVYYHLAKLVVSRGDELGVWSGGTFFPLSRV